MTQAKSGDTVAVHYTGTLDDGTVFDTSRERDPLVFTLGTGQVIAGFEEAVTGMQPGDTKKTTIPANEAYGEYRDDLLFHVEREQLPQGLTPAVGEQYQMRQADGSEMIVTVQDVTSEGVTFDANHPLAGQALTFALELMSIS